MQSVAAGPRHQSLDADRLAAALAEAVGAGVETRERVLDLRERLLGSVGEAAAELPLERERGGVGPHPARDADFVLHRPLAVLAHQRQRTSDAVTLALEQLTELAQPARRSRPHLAGRGGQPTVELPSRDPVEREHFVASTQPGDDRDVAAREAERVREQRDDGVVRPPVLGRRARL